MATIMHYTTRSNSKRPKRQPFSRRTTSAKNYSSFFFRQRELLHRVDKGIRCSAKVSALLMLCRGVYSSFFLLIHTISSI